MLKILGKLLFHWFAHVGTVLAAIWSFQRWESMVWACINGGFGWAYVLYYWLVWSAQ